MPDKKPDEQNMISRDPQQVTEEEQDLYNIFVSQGVKAVYNLADKIEGKGSIKLIGDTLFQIVDKIETEGAKVGIQFSIPVILNGAGEIFQHLLSVSRAQPSDKQLRAIMGDAIGRWIEKAYRTGKVPPDELAKMGQDAYAISKQIEDSENGPMSMVNMGGKTEMERFTEGIGG